MLNVNHSFTNRNRRSAGARSSVAALLLLLLLPAQTHATNNSIIVESGGLLEFRDCTVNWNGNVDVAGTMMASAGVVNVTGPITVDGTAEIINADATVGAVTIPSNGTVRVLNPGGDSNVTFTANGMVDVAGTLELRDLDRVDLNETVTIRSTGNGLCDGSEANNGTYFMPVPVMVEASGVLQFLNVPLDAQADITVHGQLILDNVDANLNAATLQIEPGGQLTADQSTIAGIVNNLGTVAPGASPGILTVDGVYSQHMGGTLEIELGGTAPGPAGYDRLVVTGAAGLDGLVNVMNFGGFVPMDGDQFVFLTGAPVQGTFASRNVPPISGEWTIAYATNDVTLSLAQADIDVSPPSIDFGSVPVGSSQSAMVQIDNLGTADLTVSDLAIVGDASFSMTAGPVTPFTIVTTPAPIEVTFEPLVSGTHTAELHIVSDDPDQPLFTVPTSGDAQVPMTPILDFGDAPDSTYPTLLADNGARHQVVSNWYLGNLVDAELDGQPNNQDDVIGMDDDEEGV